MKAKSDEFLYLDVLPLRSAEEAGGFSRAAVRRRGVAVAATLSSSGEFRNFSGTESCRNLVEHLRSAKCVVGFNCLAFDYELVRGQVAFRRPKTIDLMLFFGGRLSFQECVKRMIGNTALSSSSSLAMAWNKGRNKHVIAALRKRLTALYRLHKSIVQAIHPRNEPRCETSSVVSRRDADKARARMLKGALETFEHSSRVPDLIVVQNAASGRVRVLPYPANCEDGMYREIGSTRRHPFEAPKTIAQK